MGATCHHGGSPRRLACDHHSQPPECDTPCELAWRRRAPRPPSRTTLWALLTRSAISGQSTMHHRLSRCQARAPRPELSSEAEHQQVQMRTARGRLALTLTRSLSSQLQAWEGRDLRLLQTAATAACKPCRQDYRPGILSGAWHGIAPTWRASTSGPGRMQTLLDSEHASLRPERKARK